MTNFLLIIAIIVGAGTIGTVFYVRYRIRRFSQKYLGSSDLLEGIKLQQEIYDSTPKNVSGITRLELPRIEKDFPEFDWPEWKRICELTIRNYLEALGEKDLSYAADASEMIKNQVRQEIEAAIASEIEEKFESVTIHATEISRYEKKPGICRIKVETSLQYYHSLTEKGRIQADHKMEQHIYTSELIYVQNPELAGEYASAIGANCPNCGAPVKITGSRICPYCGTTVELINIRVWKMNRIDKE